jgi:ABC-2 type transport system ATP-binding protein
MMQSLHPASGIEVSGLTKRYRDIWYKETARFFSKKRAFDDSPALNNFSLSITPGEAFGLIGPNGAGKTTFMGCLLGYIFPNQGSVLIDGKPPDYLETRKSIGYLPERLTFDRWMKGYEFLSYHHALAGGLKSERKNAVEQLLDRVRLEKRAWRQPIGKYSRGMLQRIGLAQAMIASPKYLFLDEPASGVDPGGVILIREILRELRGEGITIVLNSHQLTEVESLCDRVAFIRAGAIESIHSLRQESGSSRVIRIEFALSSINKDTCTKIADGEGIVFLDCDSTGARFKVQSDDAASRLIQKLVSEGTPVTAAIPQVVRLEELFLDKPHD